MKGAAILSASTLLVKVLGLLFSIPLGLLAGFALHLPAFWIYTCLKFDQIAKTVWCVFRLRSGKWIKRISTGKQGGASA